MADEVRKNAGFALIVKCDMNEELQAECSESAVTCIEKFSDNLESASKFLKETMDKKFGKSWNVVIGEAFGFDFVHQTGTLCYMYFGGNTAVCVWKAP